MRLDKVIVIDVEATCWDPRPTTRSKEFENEIIEIGICVLDMKTTRGLNTPSAESVIVRPAHSKVSEFCTRLTTLTQEQVDKGITLKAACDLLIDRYDSKNHVWVSYGDYDRNQFQKECRDKRIDYPFGPRHINVKCLFALKNRLREEIGMDRALEKLGMDLQGTHHRAHDDAANIARIAATLF